MTGHLIEAGVYFLVFFAPLAFGGVELWGQGVIQIVAGPTVAAWAWRALEGRRRRPSDGPRAGSDRGAAVMWAAIAGFVALVTLQTVPLPPAWIRLLSPAAHSLYARTLPGYAQGRGFEVSELPGWLLAGAAGRLPESVPEEEAGLLRPPSEALGLPTRFSSRRTLSVSPFETRQRLAMILCCIGLFAAASSHFTTRERITRLLGVAVASGLLVSLLAIVQKLTWNGRIYWVRETTNSQVFGPFANRNSYAAFAVTLMPVAIGMALAWLHRAREGRRDAVPQLLLWSFAAVSLAAGIFYSLSRGGILAALASFLLLGLMVLRFGGKGADLAVMVGLAAAAAAFLVWIGPEKVIERVETISQGTDVSSVSTRLGGWRRALLMMADYPLLGSGMGTFRYAYMPYAPPGMSWWSLADNEYLELVCDTGAAGGLLVLVAVTAFTARVARPRRLTDTVSRYSYAGLAAGLSALALHSAANPDLQIPANALLLAVLAAALLGLVREKLPRRGRGADAGPGRALPWERGTAGAAGREGARP